MEQMVKQRVKSVILRTAWALFGKQLLNNCHHFIHPWNWSLFLHCRNKDPPRLNLVTIWNQSELNKAAIWHLVTRDLQCGREWIVGSRFGFLSGVDVSNVMRLRLQCCDKTQETLQFRPIIAHFYDKNKT